MHGLLQSVITLALFLMIGDTGYTILHAKLQTDNTSNFSSVYDYATSTSPASVLGDLTIFRTITSDTLSLLNKGDQPGATAHISDLEYEWDRAQLRLKAKNKTAWTLFDGKIDTVLRELRAVNPNMVTEKAALESLLIVLQ